MDREKTPGRFGQKLKKAREDRKMSRRKLAKLAKVSGSYPSNVESGEIGDPGTEIAARLAEALGLSLGELLDYPVPGEVATTGHEVEPGLGAGK